MAYHQKIEKDLIIYENRPFTISLKIKDTDDLSNQTYMDMTLFDFYGFIKVNKGDRIPVATFKFAVDASQPETLIVRLDGGDVKNVRFNNFIYDIIAVEKANDYNVQQIIEGNIRVINTVTVQSIDH